MYRPGGGASRLVPATERIVDDLEAFLSILPGGTQQALRARGGVTDLIEVVMDLARPPEARYLSEQATLGDEVVTAADINSVIAKLGQFGDDNRAGISGTLHRMSVIRNRAGDPVGLTCRVGRAVFGSVRLIEDLVKTGENILLLGRPGVGKTTVLREVARVLADDTGRRVIIVDTSNEIAGDGDVPHPAIGRARRMQVPRTELQHRVMIEAVENHMPEVIIIDEMSTELEAQAARTIAERGVQLVATAHGNSLDNLIANPSLSDLVGGTQTVTLGDLEARRRGTQKTVLERSHEPTFGIVIEIRERNHMAVHREVGTVVDLLLRGYPPAREVRWMDADGTVHSQIEEPTNATAESAPPAFELRDVQRSFGRGPRREMRHARRGPLDTPGPAAPPARAARPTQPAAPAPSAPVRIHPFGIPRGVLHEVISGLGVAAEVTDAAEGADFFLTTKSHYARRPTEVRDAEREGVPVYVLRRGTKEQVEEFLNRFNARPAASASRPTVLRPSVAALQQASAVSNGDAAPTDYEGQGEVKSALQETETAINRVLSGERKVTLAPQTAYIRRLQHGLAAKYKLGSASSGRDPGRRVVIRRRRR